MKLTLQYFAALREQRGLSEEHIETDIKTPKELYLSLKQEHGFELDIKDLKVAKGDAFCQWDEELKDNDTITFLPPVGGG